MNADGKEMTKMLDDYFPDMDAQEKIQQSSKNAVSGLARMLGGK